MLMLYDSKEILCNSALSIIRDIEADFCSIKLTKDEVTCSMLRDIEQAEYYDSTKFIDRFGLAVSVMNLSTGCKAALLVHYRPDCVVDFLECGNNARDAVIFNCKSGNMIFYERDTTVCNYKKETSVIDCFYKGKRYQSTVDFNSFLMNGNY